MAKTNSGLLEFKDEQKVLIALDDATSEVKKAVVIDADGVETDIQGVQPTGKKEITSTAEVNVANYATAQVVDADLVAGNIKKDVDILGVVGTYEAAASDFSTAEVTILDEEGFLVHAPFVLNANEYPEAGGLLPEGITPTNGIYSTFSGDAFTNAVRVALYKGVAYLNIDAGAECSAVSGDATNYGAVVKITGDCTITITPLQ